MRANSSTSVKYQIFQLWRSCGLVGGSALAVELQGTRMRCFVLLEEKLVILPTCTWAVYCTISREASSDFFER